MPCEGKGANTCGMNRPTAEFTSASGRDTPQPGTLSGRPWSFIVYYPFSHRFHRRSLPSSSSLHPNIREA